MARNMPCPPPPLLHHGPLPGARWSPHCPPQRGPQTTENQHFIELAPQKSTPADFLFAVGITVTDGGVTSTPPAAHATANPREEGSFWGQATAAWAGAGRAVNHEDPRGIIHLTKKKNKKEKTSMKPQKRPSTQSLNIKKGVIRKQLKRQQNQQGHLQGGGPGGGAQPRPRTGQQHVTGGGGGPSPGAAPAAAARTACAPGWGTPVGRRWGEVRAASREGPAHPPARLPCPLGGEDGVVKRKPGRWAHGSTHLAQNRRGLGRGGRGWRERDPALGTRRGRASEAKAPALGRCVRNGTRARHPAETGHACLPGKGAACAQGGSGQGTRAAVHPADDAGASNPKAFGTRQWK